ncbi:MAG: excinuclease ABC subunit UvrA [Tannerella sp.]|jgi:excinuclease ABC subunit A|nr:excinuclease ABC subunit UvrA [Tannerella sp.]
MRNDTCIHIKGARVNNLKNIDVDIPRDKLIVITGLSGSGKSSLAFDTLYAEGQRRYVESLSAYARQFLGRMSKPECDYITGIPPAIAIEQKVNVRNPRSTVGTSTEIYEYIRLLYARIGKTISPVSGQEVKKHQVSDVVKTALSYPEGTRFAVYAPVVVPEGRTLKEQLEILLKEGYTRLEADGNVMRIGEALNDGEALQSKNVELLIDRLAVSDDKLLKSRLADSVETAFYEGHDLCRLRVYLPGETVVHEFSKKFEADGITFEEPSELMFNFNNPVGACEQCEGFGRVLGIDKHLVVPDENLSVYEGAVACWKGDSMREWQRDFIQKSVLHNFPIHRPYRELSSAEKDLLWHGAPDTDMPCIDEFFRFVENNLYKIHYRVMLSRYRGKTICPSCHGSRLKKEALYVRVGEQPIAALMCMPVSELKVYFDNLQLNETDAAVAKRLLVEIKSRLQFLTDVGLDYLTLDRLSSSLSGGESQRINLATSLGSSLTGSLYILDEPSIGLHPRDTDRLIKVLHRLRDLGNTVVVVEHDEEIIRAADYIIDIGPNAGRLGGEIVFQGTIDKMDKDSDSYTVRYLTGRETIEMPEVSRKWNEYIEIKGARLHNLKRVNVKFPLHVMTVVSGVSGSGKSTLVRDILYEGLRRIMVYSPPSVECDEISGDVRRIRSVEFIDQNSIGKSSRSNPVTYVGAYDEIRKLYGNQPLSRRMGYTAAHFSFNKEGGRCEECKGEGKIVVEMQFMADITLECDACHGKRFLPDILEVEVLGANIYDILEMTVNRAIEFFESCHEYGSRKIVKKLKPLQAVGLGYIKLGQTSSTLSGGENQRVKLACYLGMERHDSTMFIFDEPTTGLHFHDIRTLLNAFSALIAHGHTVVVIEHHPDVIKSADYVIDLGPEGGKNGGNLVCAGTPREIAACEASYTGRHLSRKQ